MSQAHKILAYNKDQKAPSQQRNDHGNTTESLPHTVWDREGHGIANSVLDMAESVSTQQGSVLTVLAKDAIIDDIMRDEGVEEAMGTSVRDEIKSVSAAFAYVCFRRTDVVFAERHAERAGASAGRIRR